MNPNNTDQDEIVTLPEVLKIVGIVTGILTFGLIVVPFTMMLGIKIAEIAAEWMGL